MEVTEGRFLPSIKEEFSTSEKHLKVMVGSSLLQVMRTGVRWMVQAQRGKVTRSPCTSLPTLGVQHPVNSMSGVLSRKAVSTQRENEVSASADLGPGQGCFYSQMLSHILD